MHSAAVTIRDQKFTEPVALSSTASADLPLPGIASGGDFVLLALRARCKQHTNALAQMVKGVEKGQVRKLRTFLFGTAHEQILQRDKALKRRKVPRLDGTKKIRRAGFAFVHRFR